MRANWIIRNAAEAIRNLHGEQAFGANTVFSTQSWIQSSLHHLMGSRTPIVLELTTDQSHEYRFVFSHGWENLSGIPVRTLRVAGYPFTDRIIFGDQMGAITGLIRALTTLNICWDIVILDEIIAGDLPLCIDEVEASTLKLWTRTRHSAHTPVLDLTHFTDSEISNSYSKSLRTRLKRARKKLADTGGCRFERIQPGPDQVDEILRIVSDIEEKSWKGDANVGIFNAKTRDFFFEVSQGLSKTGVIDVSLLFLDEQPIAYRYGFRFQGRYYDYNFAQLPEFNKLSPGRVLLDEVIRSSFSDGLTAIDGSRGSVERPQLLGDWTDKYVDHYVLWIGNYTLPGRLAKFAVHGLRPALAQFKAIGRRSGLKGHSENEIGP